MPSPTPRLTQPERVEISNRRLVRAAFELIAEKGWEATTAAEIGRRAGYSRAMVHARYGSKDAVLETFFRDDYVERLAPDPRPDATGLERAVAHFDRVAQLHGEDPDFLRGMFIAAFEAVKTTSGLRPRVRSYLRHGTGGVEAGLRDGIRDGSVRADIDIERAAADIATAIFAVAYRWTVFPDEFDLIPELEYVRARLVRTYGRNR
ncbi:helix-turn-helix domain-containing protein [Nocardia sp. NPDC005366]|uniref:TetR/AcrR family transcriptional regulator n=1 Tax=Nocardia sp. NPDC005366 TaxID=3156878 RepID=UPI0033A7F787